MFRLPLAACAVALAASVATSQDAVPNLRVFYIGHSLMSDIPSMTRALVLAVPGARFEFRHQDIPGAPLRWQWEEEDRASEFEPQFGGRYHLHLPDGGYTTLIVTDSVPRGGTELVDETVDYLGRFVDFARTHNPDIQIYYYETWHHLTSGTSRNSEYDTASPTRTLRWRARLDADRGMWDGIVERVNAAHPGAKPVLLIPVGRVLGAVHDALEAGRIPGWTRIEDLFGDEIHTNNYGKYVVSLVHYAVLTGRSPVGAPHRIRNIWGGEFWNTRHWDGKTYAEPSPETVRAVQEVVAEALGM